MTETETSRTLVKSPPELWAECSEAASLARHLDGFGEIRITRLEPETAVAWEGERASGTVRLEPSGWGTKVTLTARSADVATPAPEPATEPEPAEGLPTVTDPVPVAVAELVAPAAGPSRGLLASLLGLFRRPSVPPAAGRLPDAAPSGLPDAAPGGMPAAASAEPVVATEAVEAVEAEPAISPESPSARAEEVLSAALESLGQAHRRPFTRG